MFQQGKDVSQTHLSNALLHAEKMYGKVVALSAEGRRLPQEAVKRVRMAKEGGENGGEIRADSFKK